MAFVSMGPWGGDGGHEWSYVFQGGLKEILIDPEGGFIKSMSFKVDNAYSPKYGTHQENECYVKISLDWPREYLVRIDGTHGQQWRPGVDIIKSLTFVTNVKTYGHYGTKNHEDTSFTIPIKNGKVVGFHGRCGVAIDAIGIHVAPT